MKRSLLASIGLLAALVPGPAGAATTYLAVEDEGPGFTALNLSCANPVTTTTQKHVAHVSGPGTPPLGTGSLRLDLSVDERAGLQFDGATHLLSELGVPGAFAVTAYSPGGVGIVNAYVKATLVGGTWHGVASLPLPAVGAWTPLDLSSATFHWVDDANANPTDLTIAAFVVAKGNGSFKAGVMADACTGNTPLYVDQLTGITSAGAVVVNFEAVYPTTLTITGGGVITAGDQATVNGKLATVGPALKNNQKVSLQADTWPAGGGFVEVATDGTKQNDTISAKQKPLTETTYRWSFPGTTDYGPSVSATVVVKVRTNVSIGVKDDTIKRGRKVVVKGATTPAKAGVKVKLIGKHPSGKKVLGVKKTKADGTYRFAERLTKSGKWKLRVKVAASTGNLAGKSAKTVVRVS